MSKSVPWKELSLDDLGTTSGTKFRNPKQKRGKQKFNMLLDAAHELIAERGLREFGVIDVAERAGVAVGSAYHFFPGVDAVLIALGQRYTDVFTGLVLGTPAADNWHDMLDYQVDICRRYMNEHPEILALLMGPARSQSMRHVNSVGDSDIARAMVASYSRHFEVPSHPPPEQLVHVAVSVLNGIWELSVLLHGEISDAFARETTRAMYAYMRQYWPERLERVKSSAAKK